MVSSLIRAGCMVVKTTAVFLNFIKNILQSIFKHSPPRFQKLKTRSHSIRVYPIFVNIGRCISAFTSSYRFKRHIWNKDSFGRIQNSLFNCKLYMKVIHTFDNPGIAWSSIFSDMRSYYNDESSFAYTIVGHSIIEHSDRFFQINSSDFVNERKWYKKHHYITF